MTPQEPEPRANGDWLVEFMQGSEASRSPFRRAMQKAHCVSNGLFAMKRTLAAHKWVGALLFIFA